MFTRKPLPVPNMSAAGTTKGVTQYNLRHFILRASAAPDVMARLIRGEPVPPEQVYFRCSPSFETASASLGWIHERLFVGSGMRQPDRVLMRFFVVS